MHNHFDREVSRARSVCISLLGVACCPLWADFEGTASGTVRCGSKLLSGADILVEVDPLWGRPNAEDLAELRKKNSKNTYPEDVSGSATTKCDDKGAFSVKITVTADNSKLPKYKGNLGGKQVDAVWVSLKITASIAGYRTATYTHQSLTEGVETKSDLVLWQLRSYEVQLVNIDRKPAAGVRVAMYGSNWSIPGGKGKEPPVFTTDDKGRLVISEDEVPGERLRLRILDEGFAFDAGAPFWTDDVRLEGGKNDGGKLTVVPGCTLKAQFVDADTDKAVPLSFVVIGTKTRLTFSSEAADGTVNVSGLPAGDYSLHVTQVAGYDQYRQEDIALKAKEVRDLGKLKLEPKRGLEVVAISDDGAEIPSYRVLLTQLKAVPGYMAATRDQTCTPKNRAFTGLSSGQWRVAVTAENLVAATAVVTLPEQTTVTITLQRGGTLKSGEDWQGPRSLYAILSTAPCFAQAGKMAAVEVERAFRDGMDPTGVYPPPGASSMSRSAVAVPAGTYLVFGEDNNGKWYRVDDVVVKLGETTQVKANLQALAEVAVVLTVQQKAQASETLLVLPKDEQDHAKAVKAATGADGVAKFKGLALGTWRLLTRRELDWLGKQKSGALGQANAGIFGPERLVTVSAGDRVEIAVDVYNPAAVWLTVKVKLAKGAKMESASIKDIYDDSVIPMRQAFAADGVFEFGPVRAGTYDFVDGDGLGNASFWSRIVVNAPPEQTIELEQNLFDLTVTLRRPKGMEGVAFSTYLVAVCDEPTSTSRGFTRGTSPKQADGKVLISGVPAGRYLLVSWAEKYEGNQRVEVASHEVVDVTKNLSVTLKFDDDGCTLHCEFPKLSEQWNDPMDAGERFLWAELRDKKGNAIEVDGLAKIPLGPDGIIWRIPAGTYDVHIFGRGFEPRTYKNVVIKKDTGNKLKVDLVLTAEVRLQFSNLKDGALLCTDISCVALDEKGGVIESGSGGRKSVFQPPHCQPFQLGDSPGSRPHDWDDRDLRPGVCQLDMKNVPVTCTRLRVSVKGYKAVEFDVKPDLKNPFRAVLTLEKE